MKLNELNKPSAYDGKRIKMPVLFLGHGSPMNAIEENDEVTFFNDKPVGGSLTMTSVKIATSAF